MIVVEVGAFDGKSYAIPYAKDNPSNSVYAIEPIPEFANRIRRYNLSNLTIETLAISDIDGVADFFVTQDPQYSSLQESLPSNSAWKSYSDKLEVRKIIQVNTLTLESFLIQHSITEIDLLIIDAQGAELQILASMKNRIHCARKIKLKIQNAGLYHDNNHRHRLISFLKDRGFTASLDLSNQAFPLEEELEFNRLSRFHQLPVHNRSQVQVPYIGSIQTPKNDHVAHLLEQGTFEGPEQAFTWLYLSAGDTFLDCGAHVGLFSAIASQRITNHGQIIAFEPHPTCFELYQDNLRALGFNHFQIFNVGLSNQSGQAIFHLGNDEMSAFSTLSDASSPELQNSSSIQVNLVTLDQILDELNIPMLHFAKLDVEGWEVAVLEGAKQSIKAGKLPLWMIEFTEANAIAAGSSIENLIHTIQALGYSLCRFDHTHLCLVEEEIKPHYGYDNLFAVLDINDVNQRLSKASDTDKNIAKDIINRWDNAVNSSRHQHSEHQLLIQLQSQYTKVENLHHQLQVKESEHQRKLAQEIKSFNQEIANKDQVISYLFEKLKEQEIVSSSLLHESYQEMQRLESEKTHWSTQSYSLSKNLEHTNQALENSEQNVVRQEGLIKHLEHELEYLSTGKAAVRKLFKGTLRRLGIYQLVYNNSHIFVPIYNFFTFDKWKPATLHKLPYTHSETPSLAPSASEAEDNRSSSAQGNDNASVSNTTPTLLLDLNSPNVEILVALRANYPDLGQEEIDKITHILCHASYILWVKPEDNNRLLLEALGRKAESITCVEPNISFDFCNSSHNSNCQLIESAFDQWLAVEKQGCLLDYDTLIFNSVLPDKYLQLIDGKLSSSAHIIILSNH